MSLSLNFLRALFMILSIFFMMTYMLSGPSGLSVVRAVIGGVIGILFGFLLIGFDMAFRRFNLRSFNIAIVGILIGYLMGQALVLVLDAILDISKASLFIGPQPLEMIKISLFLFGTYLGTIMTLRSSDELYVSIPFVKFSPMREKKKDLIIDSSLLADTRIIDLAATGLFDHQLVIPRFMIKEIYASSEVGDELTKTKAKRSLDVIKRLESIAELEVRFNDTDFPDAKDTHNKLIRLARLLDGNLLTADINRIQIASIEGVRIINIHTLSNALKPLMQAGETIRIKIQRYGKEPRQGVGYLEDGTMVVVNGGGAHIGDVIEAQVLSVKHTTSGRMIFCNASDNEENIQKQIDEDAGFDTGR